MAAEASAGPVDLLERLTGLIEHLRAFEFKLSLEDELRLLTLRDEIYHRGGSATRVEELARIVSPLVCRNPDEQERLPPILERWANIASQPKEDGPVKAPEVERTPRRTRVRLAILIVILLGVAAAFWLGGDTNSTNVDIPIGTPVGKGEPSRVETLSIYWTQVLRDLLALLPGVAAALFYWLRPRSTALARGRAPRDAAARALEIAVADSPLFRPGAVQAPLRDLRRHRQVPSNDLDVRRTVAATARRAGFVEFVRGHRYVLPDYLLLTDRTSSVDHFGDLGEVLAARLQAEQFRVTRGEYFGDPRRISLIRSDGSRDRRELERLAGEQPDTRLLLIADVADFWDPIRQQWRQWVSGLEAFGATAVLTPVPRAQWGERERALIERGFLVVAATSDGLGDLAQQLRVDEAAGHRVAHGSDEAERLERLLAAEPYRWLDDVPPPAADIAGLVDALGDTLDEGAFLHLCAIAVFPALNPRLTEQVGALLTLGDGSPAMTEQGYVGMARLPWLRRSRIPDWLRKALIEAMGPEDSARVRALWVTLLARDPGPTSQGVAFEVVAQQPAGNMVRALLRALRRGQERELAERLMLAFLADKKLPDLSLEIPGRFSSRRALPVPGPVDWAAFATALLAGLAWLQWGHLVAAAADRAAASLPEMARLYAGPLLTLAALALGALGESRRVPLISARSLSPFAVVAGALPFSLSPAVAAVFVAAALGAAAYAWSPPGLRARMLTGIDPLRLAAGDRWAVTALVLLATFGAAAAATGAGLGSLASEERAWLWPAALAANFIFTALGVLWFTRRLGALRNFAVTAAAAATFFSAIVAGLVTALLMVAEELLILSLSPREAILFVATATTGIPWAVGLVLLFGRFGRARLQAAVAAALIVAKLASVSWFSPESPSDWEGLAHSSALLSMILPLPLISGLIAATAAGLRRRGRASYLSLLAVPLLLGMLLFGENYMAFQLSGSVEEMDQARISFSIWGVGAALSWPLLRWLAPGFAEAPAKPAGATASAADSPRRRNWASVAMPVLIAAFCLQWGTTGWNIRPAAFLIPLVVYLCQHHDWRRVRMWAAVGGLPLLVNVFAFSRSGPAAIEISLQTAGDPGMYVLVLLLARFVGDAEYRDRCKATNSLLTLHVAFLVFALGAVYSANLFSLPVMAGQFGVTLVWSFTPLLIGLCLLIGWSDAPIRPLGWALAGGALVGTGFMQLSGRTELFEVHAIAPHASLAIACIVSLRLGRRLGTPSRTGPFEAGLFILWMLAVMFSIGFLDAFLRQPLRLFHSALLFPLAVAAAMGGARDSQQALRGAMLIASALAGASLLMLREGPWQLLETGVVSVTLSLQTVTSQLSTVVAAWLLAELLFRRWPPPQSESSASTRKTPA